MKAFNCRACDKESPIQRVKHSGGHAYLICVHCLAEHLVVRDETGEPTRIVGLRDTLGRD